MSGDHNSLPPTRGEGQGLTWDVVAWRVKDFADGWSLHATLAEAERSAQGTGAIIQALSAPRAAPEAGPLACGNSDERARANARIIAAAPDMLKALKRAEATLRILSEELASLLPGAAKSCARDAAACRAAIAKATPEGVATKPAADGEARQAKLAGDRTQDLPPGGHSHEG